MKTADSIEQQPERKDARDNRGLSPANTRSGTRSKRGGDFSRIAAWAWKPGQSGNPSGRPKHDVAAEIARAVFENNWEALYKAYTKAALRGNAYAFQELADRAYGRLKERIELDRGPYADMSEQDLAKRIRELETTLGVPHSEPEILPPVDSDSTQKPN